MNHILYTPTSFEVAFVLGGVFLVFLVAFLVINFSKYGGGGDYGMSDDHNDWTDDIL